MPNNDKVGISQDMIVTGDSNPEIRRCLGEIGWMRAGSLH
jgi:hypothetical protein